MKDTVGVKRKVVKQQQKGQHAVVIEYAERAVERLQRKYHKMMYRWISKNKAITAIARERAYFVWRMETGNIY